MSRLRINADKCFALRNEKGGKNKMIKHKDYIEIENHVTKIKVRGWENYKNFKYENAKVHYVGIADGKRFNVITEGNERIGDIINKICKAVQK